MDWSSKSLAHCAAIRGTKPHNLCLRLPLDVGYTMEGFVEAIQAAGHEGARQSLDGDLFVKPTNQQEVEFYVAIKPDPYMQAISCEFMGLLTEQNVGSSSERYIEDIVKEAEETQDLAKINQYITSTKNVLIVLKNATQGFSEPCILDAKLGRQLWDESASVEKRDRLDQVSQTTTSGTLGVRVAGMSVYNPTTKARVWYDRQFGRNIKVEKVVQGFSEYFGDGEKAFPMETEKKRVLANSIKDELEYIYEVLQKKELRMVSASILIIYEGDEQAFEQKLAQGNSMADEENDSEDDQNDYPPIFRVKLIDFAHSKLTPGEGPDLNSLHGVTSLIDIFDNLEKLYQ
jgi:1D-myo-inositol-tetrakisphosphate 5-kinase/inositol-polyphosphate multikinase